MPSRFAFLLAATIIGVLAAAGEKPPVIPVADLKNHGPVDFAKEVLPILRQNCLACHGHLKPKADLNLENPPMIRRGGENGKILTIKNGAASALIKICSGQDPEMFMPPLKNNVGAKALTPEQLGILKLWIDQGALGDANAGVEPLVWRPLPPGLNPINAVDVTTDGQYAACTRANQIYLYSLPTAQLAARLADPELNKDGQGNAADRDYVQALAFHPDGTVLASGGYRCVKLWRKQPQVERASLNDPKEKSAEVKCLAFHAVSHRLAKGLADGRVEIWDVDAAKIIWSQKVHAAAVKAVVLTADGAMVITGSADKTVRISNASDGSNLGEIATPAEVNAVAFNNELRQIVTGGADNVIRIWPLPESKDKKVVQIRESKSHTAAVTALEFVKDGKQLLSAAADNAMNLWNIPDFGHVKKFDHGAPVAAVAARADAKRFVTVGTAKLKLWNPDGQGVAEAKGDRAAIDARAAVERDAAFYKAEVEFHKTAITNAEKEQKNAVDALKKAQDAKVAAEKDAVAKAEAFKKASGEKDAAQKTTVEPASALKTATDARDAAVKIATSAAADSKAALDKAAQLKKVFEKSAEAKSVAEKALHDLQEKKPAPDVLKAAESKFESAKLAFERDMAMHASAEKSAQELDAKSKAAADARGAAEKTFNELTAKLNDVTTKFKAVEKTFTDAGAANKSAIAARDVADQTEERAEAALKKADTDLANFKTALVEFEARQKQGDEKLEAAKKVVTESEKPLHAVAISPSGAVIAAAGDGGLISIYNSESGRAGERFAVPNATITALKFLDDNRVVVATKIGCSVWNVNAGWKLERVIGSNGESSPFAGRVLALQFSTDGKLLAAGSGVPSRSGEIKLLDPATGAIVREFKDAHSDTVFGVAFSADGKRLASCGADRFIRIFDVAGGSLVRTFEGHTHHVLSVTWRRDGRVLASSGADKTVKFWDMITGEQKFNVENRFKKEVTSARYLWGQNVVLASGGDNNLRILKEDGNDQRNFGGEKGFLQSAAITADGKAAIAGGDDGNLRVWDASDGKLLNTFEPPK